MEVSALVGRDRELAACDAALRTIQAGDRAVLMISGEPGIGKTRLLEELSSRIIAQGGRVAWGRMWEVGLTPPFWPWVQALSALAAEDEDAPAIGSLEERAHAAARLARFAEVAAFLARRAAAAPIAILLDDLHAADLSSLQLLEYVLPLLVRQRVLLGLAARDSEGSSAVAATLSRIQRSAKRLALARLAQSEVASLVGARADGQRVFELSAGNPLFVEELLSSFRAGGTLQLPPLSSVRTVIRARVDGLSAESRAALLAAAVVGRDFRGQVVAHMLGASDLGAELRPAVALGMLAMTGPDQYRFSHALVAEAIADELEPSERARLHLRAARACERHLPTDLSGKAHHLLAAGHLAAEAAVSAAESAAEQCMAQLAFEDAAALLERARTALAMAAPENDRRRALLLCKRAEALQHASRHEDAAVLLDEAAALVRACLQGANTPALTADQERDPLQDHDRELFARIALARGLEYRFGHTDPLLAALLGEALTLLDDAGALPATVLRAKLLARLAAAQQPAPDPEGPVARAFEAIALAQQLPPRDRMDVMYVASAALVEYVEPVRLEPIHREVLALAQVYDRSISTHTRLRLCFSALERLDRRGFDVAVQAFAAEAVALGLPRWRRQLHMLEAMTALLEGRFDDATRAAAQAEAISQSLGDRAALWALDVHRTIAAWIKTAPVPEVAHKVANYPPGRAAILGWLAAQEGALQAARAALAELAGRVPSDPDLSSMVANAVAFAGDAAQAGHTYDVLAPRAGRVVVSAMVGSALFDIYDRMLLILARRAERWDAIDAHAERALAITDRLGSPVWAARVRADWAEALRERARPGDRERAQPLWREAFAAAERLGMPGLAARCRAQGAASTPTRPTGESSASRDDLGIELVQHGELWIVRGMGEEVHVKSSRGMALLARLVEEPGRELHVLDLAGASGAPDGDAGPLLDAQARDAYRTRVAHVRQAREEAEAMNDLGAIERAERELEALTAELERAFGLSGRERKAGAASERARSNVQRRVSHAIAQIHAASARLGEHLSASVKTGTFCSYAPRGRA